MKRRLLSMLLAAVMVTVMLAGCSKKGKEAEQPKNDPAATSAPSETGDSDKPADGTDPKLEKSIKILSIWAEDNDNGVLINSIAKRYQAEVNPNFSFEYELVSANDLKMKISTLAASNDLPDIFVYESGKPLKELVEADKVLDVGTELERLGVMGHMNESAVSLLKGLSETEALYDLPLGLNVEGFWYNKELFAKAGVEAPKTWDEFENVLAKLHEAGVQPLSCGAGDKWGATRLVNAYTVRLMGEDAMTKAANGVTKYTDAAYVQAAAKIQEWAGKGYFGQGVTTVDMNTAGTMLCTGQAAIFYNGSWFTSNLNDPSYNLAGEDGIGFFNVPVVDASISDENSYSMNCGNILALSKDKYDEGTSWFLKYFVEQIGNEAMSTQGSVKGYNYTVPEGDMSAYTKLVLDKINSATSAFAWYEAKMNSEVSTVAQENVQTLINGDITPEDYMQTIQDAYDLSK
ncbi:raffinose/stachyose/melibiose transport system substrate-binding protein [Anaerotaenia torta]|uniref:ABC transporter substrate-binding protein n=1 Tax=Anaerotaenia torta TaxID=433293 RepID=UPI003D203081